MTSLATSPWLAWTDGASIDNPGAAGVGFVIVSPEGERLEGYQGLGTATNNVAELTAILRVAESVPKGASLVIHTDSKYAIGVLDKAWRATKNIELIAKTKEALGELANVSFVWVKGHSDIVENIVADKLACRGAESSLMAEANVTHVEAALSTLRHVAVDEANAIKANAPITPAEGEQLVLVMTQNEPKKP